MAKSRQSFPNITSSFLSSLDQNHVAAVAQEKVKESTKHDDKKSIHGKFPWEIHFLICMNSYLDDNVSFHALCCKELFPVFVTRKKLLLSSFPANAKTQARAAKIQADQSVQESSERKPITSIFEPKPLENPDNEFGPNLPNDRKNQDLHTKLSSLEMFIARPRATSDTDKYPGLIETLSETDIVFPEYPESVSPIETTTEFHTGKVLSHVPIPDR